MVKILNMLYKILVKNTLFKALEKKCTQLRFSYGNFIKIKDYKLLILKIVLINIKLKIEKQINIIYNDKKFCKEIELYITLLLLLFIFL